MTLRHRDGFTLSTEHADVDLDRVCRWLSEESYWAKGRDHEVIRLSVAGSAPYTVRDSGGTQVAFARAVTDGATFVWICDVFVDTAHRGLGLGTWLVDSVVADFEQLGVLRFLLATKDAQEVYRRSGFAALEGADRFMEIDHRPTRAFILGHV